jgi:hypothetical protein
MTTVEMNLEGLRTEVVEPVRCFAASLTEALGPNLWSVTVVGSSLTSDFAPERSDINSVVVIENYGLEVLQALAQMGKTMRKRRLAAPVLMTPAYIERSRDVFGVEWLDFQLTHHTVLGPDPFAALEFAKGDVRLQCERQFKALLVRMRQGYIRSMNRRQLLWELVQGVAHELSPYVRAMLWLADAERPAEVEAAMRRLADQTGGSMDTALEVWRSRQQRKGPDAATVNALFRRLYGLVERLAEVVDRMEVGS